MTDSTSTENTPKDERSWALALNEVFRKRQSHPLQLAEQALKDCPKNGYILNLAAIAALLEEKPDRCLRYLKRMEKYFVADERNHLLRALALAQQGRLAIAADILKHHGLDNYPSALYWFTGDHSLNAWVVEWLRKIKDHRWSAQGPRTNAPQRTAPKVHTGKAVRKTPSTAPPEPELESVMPALSRIQTHIPIRFELTNEEAIRLAEQGQNGVDLTWFRLRAEFAHLGLLQGFDELFCLPQLRQVETYWYQVETVRKVLKEFRGRVLLADEVGLGKTVEAGMVLKEYLLRGMVENFLILTPASLVGQWREEMEAKFDIVCATSYDSLLRSDPEAFWNQSRIIASIATARRKEHSDRLIQQTYDLVIVDEAHHLKTRTTQNYKLVDALKKRFLLLLSATPVQNSLVELYNLLTLLKPGVFKTQKEFRAAYMTPGKPRIPVNRERMRDLMRDVMIRNTRALVDVRLPPRHATTLQLDAGTEERFCYQQLDALVREVHAGVPGHHRLALHHLLSAAGSSPVAAAKTIHRFAERRNGDRRWLALSERYASIARGCKEKALLEMLQRNPGEKKIVFVHRRETLDHLDGLLVEGDIPFARFEGSLAGPDKDAAIAQFRDQVPVLLCTESGGEGRNVQFCNTLINFDLPWNPMAIEQRIGRIHRIGQQREVFIFNLVSQGTLESHVLQILDEKINMFELVVGEIDAILGELDEQQDFSEMVFSAWVENTEQERTSAFVQLGDSMVKAKQQYEAVKALDEELFGDEFETA
jgi:superfamily II DNA or RNA helicase